MLDPTKTDGRRWLLHDVPAWIDPDSTDFFVTICCQHRGANQLCRPGIGEAILSAARFYHEQCKWLLTLFLIIPDHIHLIASFGKERKMIPVVSAWKRYLSVQHGVIWQKNFFDHRLRSESSAAREVHHILQNPVRAGLAKTAAEWPFLWTPPG